MATSNSHDPIAQIMTVTSCNATAAVEELAKILAKKQPIDCDVGRIVRHLAALAFRLEGEKLDDLSTRVYDIAKAFSQPDVRWELSAIESSLSKLTAYCELHQFEYAEKYAARMQKLFVNTKPNISVQQLMESAWKRELHQDLEGCLHYYRFALEVSGGNTNITTVDGQNLTTKLRNLSRLRLDALTETRQFDEAIALHAKTQNLIGSGPLALYHIVSVSALRGSQSVAYSELRPSRPIPEACVKFVGEDPILESEPGDLIAPPQYFALLRECTTFPRSNIVIMGDKLVYDVAAHRRRDDILIQDGVLSDQIVMAGFGARHALVEKPKNPMYIENGLSMFGLQSRNYGHWFCEFIPRMLAYNHSSCPDDIPLCIDDHMPATHEEVIRLLDKRNRPILKLPPSPVAFGWLGLAPVPAFFPFEMKQGRRVYDTIWPTDILQDLRTQILDGARARGALGSGGRRRLFISRKAFAQRQLVNEVEIAEALRPHGFEVITPETMTFLEQVDAFHAAEIIVGSSSSALTNGLFCQPDCRILGLIHADLSFNFRGYTSFIEAGGAQITFLRGKTAKQDGHAFHASYTIPPGEIIAALDQLHSPASVLLPSRKKLSSSTPPSSPRFAATVFRRILKTPLFTRGGDPK